MSPHKFCEFFFAESGSICMHARAARPAAAAKSPRARHDAAILMAHRPSYLPVIGAEAAGAPPAHVLDVPTGQPALLPSRRGG